MWEVEEEINWILETEPDPGTSGTPWKRMSESMWLPVQYVHTTSLTLNTQLGFYNCSLCHGHVSCSSPVS